MRWKANFVLNNKKKKNKEKAKRETFLLNSNRNIIRAN